METRRDRNRGRRGMIYPLKIEQYKDTYVVRDDLINGGTKRRAMSLIPSVSGMIYPSPAWGGAAVAMSYECKDRGIPCSIFYPKRNRLTARQNLVRSNGARIMQVPFGRLNVIKSHAKKYEKESGHYLVRWGGGNDANKAIKEVAVELKKQIASEQIDSLWCASGSGTLISALSEILDIPCYGVIVGYGLKASDFPRVKKFYKHPLDFSQQTSYSPPFPSCKHYDAKAYEIMQFRRKKGEKTIFWNVMSHHK